MDLLKREMEKKRKALREAKQKMMIKQSNGGGGGTESLPKRRFLKTTEIRRIVEEEAMKGTKRIVATNKIDDSAGPDSFVDKSGISTTTSNIYDTKNFKRQKLDSMEEPSTSNTALHGQETQATTLKLQDSLEAIQHELRLLGLPVTYFGETSVEQRWQRLQHAQTHKSIKQLQEREADEFRLKQGFGIRNTFLEKDSNDTQLMETGFQLDPNNNDHDKNSHSKRGKETTDVVSSNNDSNTHNSDINASAVENDDDDDKHKRIYKHFKGLLKQWENDLNQRSDEVKRSLAGRNETKKVKQCKDYIRPLFQLCKRRQLDDNMADKLFAMVLFCEQGEFVRAHDAYMDIAIGRAAWPIGVTMVGIHARTGRAKIESSNVAHVMNSELQRKYLTSVKRLLTYEQNQRTDVDPSKKVR